MLKNLFTLCLIFPAFLKIAEAQNKIYVKANAVGTKNGASWGTAYSDLQYGINSANVGDSVFVSKGTYQPANGQSFSMKQGVKIYGSFQGTEVNLSQRQINTSADSSILKGNGNRVIYNNFTSGSSMTVASVLNGFTITGGNTTGNGGGIYNFYASPTLSNLCINGNRGDGGGGGIANYYSSSPVLTKVTINENITTSGGGGIDNRSSSPILINVSIRGNTANYGGGIYNSSSSFPELTNLNISGNKVSNTGAGIANEFSAPTLTNVTISGNKANGGGGGIYNYNSTPILKNSILFGNESNTNDNGIYNISNSAPTIYYSLVQGLTSNNNGNISSNGITATDIFTNPVSSSNTPTLLGDYSLKSSSPAIDKGNNTYFNVGQTPDLSNITADILGEQRIKNNSVDLGAYESPNITLPVTLTSYTVQKKLNFALLEWRTLSESNNLKFIISRSSDGSKFVHIASVTSNFQSNSSYLFMDYSPAKEINYYRLQQQDLDGTTITLGIKTLTFTENKEIKVFPNPAQDEVTISFPMEIYSQVNLLNLNGQKLNSKKIDKENSTAVFDFRSLSSGNYILELQNANKTLKFKVIKQ